MRATCPKCLRPWEDDRDVFIPVPVRQGRRYLIFAVCVCRCCFPVARGRFPQYAGLRLERREQLAELERFDCDYLRQHHSRRLYRRLLRRLGRPARVKRA